MYFPNFFESIIFIKGKLVQIMQAIKPMLRTYISNNNYPTTITKCIYNMLTDLHPS